MVRRALYMCGFAVLVASSQARAADGLERLGALLRRPPSPIGVEVAQTRRELAALDAKISTVRKAHYLRDDSRGPRGRKALQQLLAPLRARQAALSDRYVALLRRTTGLSGTTVVASFDVSLFSLPGYLDAGLKLGGRVSGEGTGRPLLQLAPELIIDTAAGVYSNITWDPDKKRISPSYTLGVGPIAVTSYNPLYGKRLQLIIPGVLKLGISRSCIGGTCKIGLPVGPRVGGTVFVEHPRLLPLTNWFFDRIEGATAKLNRIPGFEQRCYDVRRAVTRSKAKLASVCRRVKSAVSRHAEAPRAQVRSR